MNEISTNPNEIPTTHRQVVRRRDRGLSVAGTRITLYFIMVHIKEGYSPEQIQAVFKLTDEQITNVMDYIDTHKNEFESEYQLVLQQAEERRQYWEKRNREQFAKIAAMPAKPGTEALRAKLQAKKAEWGMSL